MSTPQNPQNQNPQPYADPAQEHVPGQAAWTQGDQSGYEQGGYQQGGYQQGGYRHGGYQAGGYRPTSYLQGAPVGFGDAVRGAFQHPLTFRGRASRSAFWWFQLLAVIAYAVVSIISDRSTVAGIILDIIIGVPMIVTHIALAVRRLHDSDHRGWWWWIALVPVVGWIVAIVFYLLPSTPGPNRFNTVR